MNQNPNPIPADRNETIMLLSNLIDYIDLDAIDAADDDAIAAIRTLLEYIDDHMMPDDFAS